uniref:Acid phosphatase n=1 Tax=Romanomermis culicivorax TaxID=13658 RepID=A0A915JMH7_ROMCU
MQKVVDLLNYLNYNYRNVIANMPLDVNFETKWDKLSNIAPCEPKTEPKKLCNVNGQDHLEKIDKRNFILTLSDQELTGLTENELSKFFEYLNEKEVNDLLMRRRILCLKNDKVFINNIDVSSLTRIDVADIFEKLQKIEDVLAFKQYIFEFLSRQIDVIEKIDNQWSSINELVDFLDVEQADEIRNKFQQNVRREENPQIVDDSVKKLSNSRKNSSNPTRNSTDKENLRDILVVSPFTDKDAKKTSTPLADSKNVAKIVNKKPMPLPALNSDSHSQTNVTVNQGHCTQKESALHFEQVRRQLSSLSDDTVNKLSIDDLEQQYFGFMSPEEILDMLQRKKSDSRSLSSSFFRRSVPSESVSPELFDPEVSKAGVFSPEDVKVQINNHNSTLSSFPASGTSISPVRNFIKPEAKEYFKITPNISMSNSSFSSKTSKNDQSFEALQQLSDSSSPFMSLRPKKVVFQADASFIVETDENIDDARAELTSNRNENSTKSSTTVDQSVSSNICRSPVAEAVFIHLTKEKGVADDWLVDSAATADYHIGLRPDRRAIEVLKGHGISDYRHIVRQICDEDFEKFDFIFGMDDDNIEDLKELYNHAKKKNSNTKAQIKLLGSYDSDGDKIIQDPYYTKGLAAFETVYEKCVRSCNGFLDSQK